MKSRLFDLFCEMLDRTPAEAVLPVVEAEFRMLEDDFASKRVSITDEVNSVWSFCNFLRHAGCETVRFASTILLPIEHLAFYRNTVERLVDAGLLPGDAKERFDRTFSTEHLPPMTLSATG